MGQCCGPKAALLLSLPTRAPLLKVAQQDPECLKSKLFVELLFTASDPLVFLRLCSATLGQNQTPLGLFPSDCPCLAPFSLPTKPLFILQDSLQESSPPGSLP